MKTGEASQIGGSNEEKHAKGFLTFYSELGGRSYQEDRLVAETIQLGDMALQVMAVMDGHNGSGVAQLAADKLIPSIREAYEPARGIIETLKTTVSKLNEATKRSSSGSTLSIVAIPEEERRAYVAILGDSPVIIADDNGKINISPEHNVRSNLTEREKAIERGALYDNRGFICTAGSGLQMSRALGDREFDPFLDRNPDTYSVKLGAGSFIVAATDGVLDPKHQNTTEEAVRLAGVVREDRMDAEAIVRDAIKRGGTDNATAIVWRMAEAQV